MRGNLPPEELGELRDQLAEEFPSGDAIMNRELIRLLAYLQADSILDRSFEYLRSEIPNEDKVHIAIYLRFLKSGWTTERRFALLKILSDAKQLEGGSSYPYYIGNVTRDFAKQLSFDESLEVLRRGDQWPDAALGALYKLPRQLDEDTRQALQVLDKAIDTREDTACNQLKVGIAAILARSGDEASMAYLRAIWERNPERREPVAMGLAQAPGGENWHYLIRSLPILEGMTVREVLRALQTVPQAPDDPEHLRQVILAGLRLQDQGAEDAIVLLQFWTGQNLGSDVEGWKKKMAAWQAWFHESYPDCPEAVLPKDTEENKWIFDELLEHLRGDEGKNGDSAKGRLVFEKATCEKCHRFGGRGESMGPDLTTLSKRFTRKEILQSILHPSHVISSQYAAKTLLLIDGRQITGIVGPGAEGEKLVLKNDGEKINVPEEEIDELTPSRISAMPTGLLRELTLEEIANLFAYLGKPPAEHVARESVSDESTQKR
jgi:putative heme-binding domain-containing protein